MGQLQNFVYEQDRDQLREHVTVEMLVGAGFIAKSAARPKSDPHLERRRLEAIDLATEKFLRNISNNAKTLRHVKLAREYAMWFEVYNGEKPLIGEMSALAWDPDVFAFGLQAGYWAWEERARRAAVNKSLLGQMLASTTDPRERRIIRVRMGTPKWVDYGKIMEVYRLRDEMNASTGIEHHVDHVVPLAGRTATGFHVHDNLQVLTAEANIRKLNKFNDWA
jgi:hypothetical protein